MVGDAPVCEEQNGKMGGREGWFKGAGQFAEGYRGQAADLPNGWWKRGSGAFRVGRQSGIMLGSEGRQFPIRARWSCRLHRGQAVLRIPLDGGI